MCSKERVEFLNEWVEYAILWNNEVVSPSVSLHLVKNLVQDCWNFMFCLLNFTDRCLRLWYTYLLVLATVLFSLIPRGCWWWFCEATWETFHQEFNGTEWLQPDWLLSISVDIFGALCKCWHVSEQAWSSVPHYPPQQVFHQRMGFTGSHEAVSSISLERTFCWRRPRKEKIQYESLTIISDTVTLFIYLFEIGCSASGRSCRTGTCVVI